MHCLRVTDGNFNTLVYPQIAKGLGWGATSMSHEGRKEITEKAPVKSRREMSTKQRMGGDIRVNEEGYDFPKEVTKIAQYKEKEMQSIEDGDVGF